MGLTLIPRRREVEAVKLRSTVLVKHTKTHSRPLACVATLYLKGVSPLGKVWL
jgi:hypothetical protein